MSPQSLVYNQTWRWNHYKSCEDYWSARKYLYQTEFATEVEENYQEEVCKFCLEERIFVKNGRSQDFSEISVKTENLTPWNEDPEIEKIKELQKQEEKEEMRKIEEECLQKYAYDGVVECAELALELQYLVGREFIDNENGGLYEVYDL